MAPCTFKTSTGIAAHVLINQLASVNPYKPKQPKACLNVSSLGVLNGNRGQGLRQIRLNAAGEVRTQIAVSCLEDRHDKGVGVKDVAVERGW